MNYSLQTFEKFGSLPSHCGPDSDADPEDIYINRGKGSEELSTPLLLSLIILIIIMVTIGIIFVIKK